MVCDGWRIIAEKQKFHEKKGGGGGINGFFLGGGGGIYQNMEDFHSWCGRY